MGYADRDYYRAGPQRPVSRFVGIPVVKWLLISNLVIFLIDLMYRPDRPLGAPSSYYVPSGLGDFGIYSIETALQGGQVWRLFTFQFLHADFMHVAMNMWALYMFGPITERWWGSKAFLIYYLLCGIGGALFYTLLVFLPGFLPDGMIGTRLLGASAGVFGVLVGVAVLAPRGQIRLLFPPIAMTMKTFALVFIGIEVFLLLTNSANAGGSAGHLGGALVGYLLMKVPALQSVVKRWGQLGRASGKRVAKAKPKARSKLRPRSKLSQASSGEVDRILDKINSEGLQSLTEEERNLLRREADK